MGNEPTTRSDMALVKLLESGRRLGQMFAKLRKVYLTAEEMREIITTISAEPRVTEWWNDHLMYIERNGILHGLEYDERFLELDWRENGIKPEDRKYDQNDLQREFTHLHPWAQGRGSRYVPNFMGVTREYADAFIDDENNYEPFLCPKIRDDFKSIVGTQWTIRINGLDALSQVGAIISVDDADSADQWAAISDKVWTSWAYTQGNNAILKGGVKKGKTNFALLLAEKFMAESWMVVSNIAVKDAPGNYKYCPDLSTMLTAICQARLKGLSVLIVFDEASLFWAKMDASTRVAKEMSKLLLTYGKLHAQVLIIQHYASDIPTAVVRTIVAEFEKTSTKNVYVDIREGVRLRPRLVTSVPATTLSYNPDQVQSFDVNMRCGEVFAFASRIPEGENQWTALLEYIPNHVVSIQEDYAAVGNKELAQALRAKGMGVNEIARQLKEPKANISRWTSEQKIVGELEKKSSKDLEQGGTA
jgi:hypothetical protein